MTQTKSISAKQTRKFKEESFYASEEEGYYLLPFRFHKVTQEKEVLVNEVGDYLVVNTGTAQKIISKQLIREEEPELYADLTAGFFISPSRIPALIDVLATRYRTKKSFLDNFTSLHIFVISLRCEHTCHYCQVSRASMNREAFDMSQDHIEKGIALMMRSPNPHVTMEFQGGEALLAFDNIVFAVLKAKEEAVKTGKEITFVICTNLALINEDILAFCLEHSILISTSLDGPEHIHNANRHRPGRNSYELAKKGIELCREKIGHTQVSALLTTTNLSLDHPAAIVDEYFNSGFRAIFLRPISPYGFATHNEKKNKYDASAFLGFYKHALEHILNYNRRGIFYREEYATIILRKILTPFPVGYVDLQSPAGMINNVIVFNYNGNVYATDESRMLSEMGDETFLLGHLDSSTYDMIFYGENAQRFSEVWANESLPGCSECAFQPYCGADPVYHHATQGDLGGHRPTSGFCQRNMEIIRHLFELMEDKGNAAIFNSWVNGN